MKDWQKQQIGRLAFREEGRNWNAYYALPNTMAGAIFLGSLHMNIARHPARQQQFMDFMREVVADLIEDAFGERPDWSGAQSAPEHERAGKA